MKTDEGIKYPCVVGMRCNEETKTALERLADSMGMTVSRLVARMVERGMELEEERSKKILEMT